VAVGSDLVDGKTIAAGDYQVFTERARKYLEIIQTTRAEMAG
jgi:2-keto-3-deoxy-6-phosphogluconate aldolase